MRRSLLTALLLGSSSAAPQEPTFSAGTRLVQVDTVVRNSKGPVSGLTKEDFAVLDSGKPRKIAVFSVQSARSSVATAAPLPAGAASNRLNSRGETPTGATICRSVRLNTPISDQPYPADARQQGLHRQLYARESSARDPGSDERSGPPGSRGIWTASPGGRT
jgi:hypothetical protein